jgi:hypothetical protein
MFEDSYPKTEADLSDIFYFTVAEHWDTKSSKI